MKLAYEEKKVEVGKTSYLVVRHGKEVTVYYAGGDSSTNKYKTVKEAKEGFTRIVDGLKNLK